MLKKGSRGSGVEALQKLLNLRGYGPLVEDGDFGPGTERSVKRAQRGLGLSADGLAGPSTMSALKADKGQKTAATMQDFADLFPKILDQEYLLIDAQTPEKPRGIRLRSDLIGYDTINCTQFTTWIVSTVFNTTWSSDQWARWQNTGRQRKTLQVPNYGPRVALDWKIATTSPGDGMHLIQYFTKTGGHSMLVVDHDPETDKILTLEANSFYGLDGVGWAQIGNLRDVPNPGPNWKDFVTQTWASRIGSKLAVHSVRLSVNAASIQDWLAY